VAIFPLEDKNNLLKGQNNVAVPQVAPFVLV